MTPDAAATIDVIAPWSELEGVLKPGTPATLSS